MGDHFDLELTHIQGYEICVHQENTPAEAQNKPMVEHSFVLSLFAHLQKVKGFHGHKKGIITRHQRDIFFHKFDKHNNQY